VVARLEGAVVAVTGASAGIGREAALLFAKRGARLAVCARRLDRLETLAQSIGAAGSEALVMVVDVGEREAVRRFIDLALARFGRLDVLVNNAGYGVRGRVENVAAEAYEELMRVNYLGTVHGCQAAVPIMRRQGSGVLINVSSIVGHRALPMGGAYAATKAAQISLTEALRVELRGSGVHACSVHPVGTLTEFAQVAGGDNPMGPQQSALTVAQAIVSCAERPRPEVYPYGPSRLVPILNALAPGIVDALAFYGSKRAGRLK
jgi:NADP-dependent 3-hydroxy acid dehydrogenase YdfG